MESRISLVLFAGVLLALAACVSCVKPMVQSGASTVTEMEQTEANHQRLVKATPPPTFEHSLEREMLVRRLKTLNVQNKTMYIYCLGLNGNVVYYGLVKGKVSSLNSLLTTPEQVAAIPYKNGTSGYHYEKLPSPDFDGSYGKNPEGVFWFDPDGTYHEWSGTYFLSDRPVTVNTPISLTATVDLEKKGK